MYHPAAKTRIREMEPLRHASILVTKAGNGDVEKPSFCRKLGIVGLRTGDGHGQSQQMGDGFYERAFK
jgi:hypothetical protein